MTVFDISEAERLLTSLERGAENLPQIGPVYPLDEMAIRRSWQESAAMLRAAAREIAAMRKAIDEVIAVEGGNRTGLGVAIARLKHVREVHQ